MCPWVIAGPILIFALLLPFRTISASPPYPHAFHNSFPLHVLQIIRVNFVHTSKLQFFPLHVHYLFSHLSLATCKTGRKDIHLKVLSATGSTWLRVRRICPPPVLRGPMLEWIRGVNPLFSGSTWVRVRNVSLSVLPASIHILCIWAWFWPI